ncbi:MAG TPA: hypothetical protein VFR86_03535 [Burkholderiaceae bacterium]|nr:hypothetical protein [Burkholderiaceae bacterium]
MNLAESLPPTATRVEENTPRELNAAIRARDDAGLMRLEEGEAAQVAARLAQLDREWDIERALQTNAAWFALGGLALGVFWRRPFLLLPAAVFFFFGQHALQGWCPPVALLRRLGVRTQREIERERFALKALRGDFDSVPGAGRASLSRRVRAAMHAVDR